MSREKRNVGLIRGNGSPIIAVKPARNAKCKCGSGKKAKFCCGAGTKYYHSREKPVNRNSEQ